MSILAEVYRGNAVESVHTGSLAVCDAKGGLVFARGEPQQATFPRSAIKGLQALPLLASGAADRFGLSAPELALACASHTGLPVHTETAASMLAKAGCAAACLECGAHWPTSSSAARALAAAGRKPGALHNNCSGKHAGFVCTAVATGRDPAGYIRPDHPTMRGVTAAVAQACGVTLDDADAAVDGCSIPTFALPLAAVATGFARFGTGEGLPAEFADGAARLRAAVAANPVMVAGDGRFDTEITAALGAAAFVKTGAEGVHAGCLPGLGLGFALKIEDGANRAADACAAALLLRFLGESAVAAKWADQTLTNWNGITVGRIVARLG